MPENGETMVHSEGIRNPWLDDWTATASPEPEHGCLGTIPDGSMPQDADETPELVRAMAAEPMSPYDNIGESATADTIRTYLRERSCDRSIYMTVLHNSATAAADDRGLATVKAFARYHMEVRGWKAIGYHFVIDTKGVIWAGRKMSVVGAHAGATGNPGSIGVCLIGNLETTDRATDAQKRALAALHTALCDLFYGGASRRIRFHREFMNTACPGKITVDEVMGWVNSYSPVTPPAGASSPILLFDAANPAGRQIGLATIIGNTAYTPVRTAFEAIGFKVEWIAAKYVANLTSPGKTPIPVGNVSGTPAKPRIIVDGITSAVGMTINGSTYTPVRATFESAGYRIDWESDGIHVSKPFLEI